MGQVNAFRVTIAVIGLMALAACAEPATLHEGAAAGFVASATPQASATTGAAPTTAVPGQPAPTGSPRRSTPARQAVSVRIAAPLGPGDTTPFTGVFQDTCGWPNRAVVVIFITDYQSVSYAEFDYHVQVPSPFRGTKDDLRMLNGGQSWSGLIGPFPVVPANSAGGKITVTGRVIYKDGSTKTATDTSVLKPCQPS